jgi:hypothetical protein
MNTAGTQISEIPNITHTWSIAYYIWATIFYLLCVAILVLPALVAADLFSTMVNRILAALTVIGGVVVNWANLGLLAGNFEKARDDLRLASMRYNIDKDGPKLLDEYAKARALVRSWSPGIPQTSTTKEQK